MFEYVLIVVWAGALLFAVAVLVDSALRAIRRYKELRGPVLPMDATEREVARAIKRAQRNTSQKGKK